MPQSKVTRSEVPPEHVVQGLVLGAVVSFRGLQLLELLLRSRGQLGEAVTPLRPDVDVSVAKRTVQEEASEATLGSNSSDFCGFFSDFN